MKETIELHPNEEYIYWHCTCGAEAGGVAQQSEVENLLRVYLVGHTGEGHEVRVETRKPGEEVREAA